LRRAPAARPRPARRPCAWLPIALGLAASSAGATERLALTVETAEGPRTFQVERAVAPDERARGLMFRRSMPQDEGMLFDFGEDRPVSMWMKNTYIPLDMIFIGSDRRVKHVAERTTPLSERSVGSSVPVRYVLEINAGLSDALGIEPGRAVSGPALDEAP
jgi:uncharacterized protein